jgi:DnaJ-domain-containing protein 1
MPTLSLHEGTKVLIVKATAPQHEIIQQIMTSLKENEQAGAQDQGALRR